MTTRPNSEIVPTWQGRLIPEVWGDVQRGLAKERDRLRGSRFVTVVLQRSFDIDGLTEWIYFGRAWNDAEQARAHVEEELGKCVGLYVRSRGYNADPPWRELDPPSHVRWPPGSLWPTEGPIQGVKWGDGTGFNSEEYHGAVFPVDPQDPLPDALLAVIGQETELVRYLQGTAHRR
jgi:hypothetical protein